MPTFKKILFVTDWQNDPRCCQKSIIFKKKKFPIKTGVKIDANTSLNSLNTGYLISVYM